MPTKQGDISPQLNLNDTNQMLASILLELKVMSQILMLLPQYLNEGQSFTDEIADIRYSMTITDVTNQS